VRRPGIKSPAGLFDCCHAATDDGDRPPAGTAVLVESALGSQRQALEPIHGLGRCLLPGASPATCATLAAELRADRRLL
jgi:hypothetical protein